MLWNAVVPIVLVRVSLQEALLRVGLILAATAVAVVWLQVAYKRGRLAAFVPVGVYIRVRTRVERIPWAKVEKARLNGRDAEILWRGRLMPLLLFGFFEDKQEAEAFCEAVMEARKHYSKPADGEAA
ncbi:MAG: hypothetical protein KKB50_16755 [Planctomycetes bacterium]|nr:hypothetical protein [Planctomycetota bacterium]